MASERHGRLASAYGWLTLEIWLLIALGGGVRAMNAGLACPDWPLCFGDVIPDYHPQVYFEFIHRAMAGMVSIVSVVLAILVWRKPAVSKRVKWASIAALVVLLAQVILGGLTVLWLLHEKVVAAHLMLGTIFYSINLYIYLALKPSAASEDISLETVPRGLALAGWLNLGVILLQILLGGLVASHYAALTCTDFPTCHGKFIPTLSGIIGLHVIHRLWAYVTALFILGLSICAWRTAKSALVRRQAGRMVAVVLWQIALGIANVLLLTPPLITVLHLATGVALFGLALQFAYTVRGLVLNRSAAPSLSGAAATVGG